MNHMAAILLAGLLAPTAHAGTVGLSVPDGHITVGDVTWFKPGNLSVTVGGQLYSHADGSLKATGTVSTTTGKDALGPFTAKTHTWAAGNTAWTTSTRDYGGKFTVFAQTWPDGADGTAAGKQGASSCFPAIDPDPADGKPRGFVSWQGRFLEASKGGEWEGGGRNGPGVGTGDGGGPFVVFGQPMAESLVFSAVANFMTNTPSTSPAAQKGDSTFCFGLDAPVQSVPAGYSLETIVFLGEGVNAAMKDFGTTLLSKYGTVRPIDYTRQWLGFSTDNGACLLSPVALLRQFCDLVFFKT
eukprot:SAG11_NODE_2359_length_3464_cov_2.039525_5_plen_299_part_00